MLAQIHSAALNGLDGAGLSLFRTGDIGRIFARASDSAVLSPGNGPLCEKLRAAASLVYKYRHL